jgi:hypothetical protein
MASSRGKSDSLTACPADSPRRRNSPSGIRESRGSRASRSAGPDAAGAAGAACPWSGPDLPGLRSSSAGMLDFGCERAEKSKRQHGSVARPREPHHDSATYDRRPARFEAAGPAVA